MTSYIPALLQILKATSAYPPVQQTLIHPLSVQSATTT
jgi:hypothetical protein